MRHVTISSLLAIKFAMLTPGCLGGEPAEDQLAAGPDDGKADWGGGAARVFYRCETATMQAATGETWRYQTSAFNNTVPSTLMWISREAGSQVTELKPIVVTKIGTDTFSDGKTVTVKLEQKGAGKSINVTHHSLNQIARAANGWCSRHEVPPPTGHQPHNFFYGTKSWASREWTFATAGSTVVDVPVVPKLKLAIPFDSDPNKPVWGTLTMSTPCSPIASVNNLDGSLAGGNSPGAAKLRLFFDALELVLAVWSASQCVANGGYDDSFMPIKAQIGTSGLPAVPAAFLDGCGRGSDTMYLVHTTQTTTTLMCVRGYAAVGAANRDYLRVRAISANDFRTSDWLSVVDES